MADFPFRIVGFDLDGTLFDTHKDLGHALNHALSRAGRPDIPLAETRDLIGGGSLTMLERAMIATGGAEPGLLEALHADLLAHYEANIATHTRLFPGGEEMLGSLAERGVALALVTNKREHLARRLLAELGLSDRFFTLIGGDTLGPGRGKPAPDPLLEMIARGPPGRAAYVGDTTYDTRAARAAGIPCAAVRFGFCDVPPDELGADALIDSFAELIPTLERL
jgi:phosphoglycolate phosphatase